MQHQTQQQLIEQLQRKLGINIPLYQGSAVIHFEDGQDIGLDFSAQSTLVTIHSTFSKVSAYALDKRKTEDILQLNSRIDVLHGGWLGLHAESNSLRYIFSIPLAFASVDLIINLIETIFNVKKDIASRLFPN